MHPEEFLNYVHEIDLTSIKKNEELSDELKKYNGKKIIFTNGSDKHAKKVLNKIGLDKTIDHIFDIIKADYIPKPAILTYKKVIKKYSLDPDKTIMIDDLPNNLKTAKELGIKTVLIKKDFFIKEQAPCAGISFNFECLSRDIFLLRFKKFPFESIS